MSTLKKRGPSNQPEDNPTSPPVDNPSLAVSSLQAFPPFSPIEEAADHNDNQPDDTLPALRPTYPIRALIRKTLAYQKRQWFTNVVCVFSCPFFMVIATLLLTIIFTAILSDRIGHDTVLYCSRHPALDGQGIPIRYIDQLPVVDGIPQANWLTPVSPDAFVEIPGSPAVPCVYWFNATHYPTAMPYAPPFNTSLSDLNPPPPAFIPLEGRLNASTTFTPNPPYGWLYPFADTSRLYDLFNLQTWPWFFTIDNATDGHIAAVLGHRHRQPAMPAHDFYDASVASPLSDSAGMLAFYDTVYRARLDNVTDYLNTTFDLYPYFLPFPGNSTQLDDALAERLAAAQRNISTLSSMPLYAPNSTYMDLLPYYMAVTGAMVETVPAGAFVLNQLDFTQHQFNYVLQTGGILPSSGKFVTTLKSTYFRRLLQHAQFVQTIAQTYSTTTPPPAGGRPFSALSQGIRAMPQRGASRSNIPLGAMAGIFLFPYGVSFLLPIFTAYLVKENEDRIAIMMRMNGLPPYAYWLTHYVHFFVLFLISSTVFIVTGVAARLQFFTATHPLIYILLFLVWGHLQIAMAFLLHVFFRRSVTASMALFMLVGLSISFNLGMSVIYADTNVINYAYYLYPPFAFYWAIVVLNKASYLSTLQPYTLSMVVPGDPVFYSFIFMVVESIVIFLLAFYLIAVWPSEYGLSRPWHFIFTFWCRRRSRSSSAKRIDASVDASKDADHIHPSIPDGWMDVEDMDVREERERIQRNDYDPHAPLILDTMKKRFGHKSPWSVNGVSLVVEQNTILGLLGPNGAGKTTLIHILIGLYPATSGKARLVGCDLAHDMALIYQNVGICPQHDILWDDLTVEEHLLFYARIKGIPRKTERHTVTQLLHSVVLYPLRHRLAKQLSGGERRRLSIAIALSGHVKLVFLDEPTTGLDPEVRRTIWNIIHSHREGKAIVLTTHSLEEAEVLCQRIGIMAKGTLRCLGSQVRLKNRFGKGFRLTMTAKEDDVDRACRYVESLLPFGWTKRPPFHGSVVYEFPIRTTPLEIVATQPQAMAAQNVNTQVLLRIFEELEDHREEYGIQVWGLSQSSLDDVFFSVVNDEDAEPSPDTVH